MSNLFKWKAFAFNICSKDVVPVIGNDLSLIRLQLSYVSGLADSKQIIKAGHTEGDHLIINLYKYLAFSLWYTLDDSKNPVPVPTSLNNTVLHLQHSGITENQVNSAVKKLINNLTDDQIVLEPYRNLVRISGFETFISVNIDNFLERAFELEGRRVNRSFNFSIPVNAADPDNRVDPALPRIYNIMGSLQGTSFVLCDEQSLEYVYSIQNGNDAVAKSLFDTIKQKNILLVGSSFPDWFMRFFIRIISMERLRNGAKAKYIACDNTIDNVELIDFLENNTVMVIPIGSGQTDLNGNKVYRNSIEFIEEMVAQCSGGEIVNGTVKYKEVLFISYCHDDKPAAERLRNELERNGVNVFFDDDSLKTGDRYNQVIKNYIKGCDYFVALISKNAIQDKNRYVYEKEWRSAIVLNDYKEKSYILPFIIDDTQPTDERIPEEMRSLNIRKIPTLDDLSQVVKRFIKEISLSPTA
jgi:TIR domain-containing protein/SIR2-like protein